jgi:high-affinity Fe2+/Pb2+ permease
MQDLIYWVVTGFCVWINYRRAKIKSARILTGILLALFLNFIGVGIFYLTTRTRKPPKPPVNSMTSN